MRATLAVTVVALGLSATGCAELDFPTDRDTFFDIVAVTFQVPELCGRINPRADGGGGSANPAGYQITTLQSSCYRNLANAMQDTSLCDRVVAVRTFALDGRKMDKADCRARGGSESVVTPDPHRMEPSQSTAGRHSRAVRITGPMHSRMPPTSRSRFKRSDTGHRSPPRSFPSRPRTSIGTS